MKSTRPTKDSNRLRHLVSLIVAAVLSVRCAGFSDCAQAEDENRDKRRPTISNSLGMTLTLVPAGEFLMGAPDDDDLAQKHEKPQHKVRIGAAFYLGRHEVTVTQFQNFVTETGFKTAAESDGKGASGYDPDRRGFEYESGKYSWRTPGYTQNGDHPVVNVNWHDAQAFCSWLSKKEGRRYRLPTEAEWEYACRAGTTTRFTIGNSPADLRSLANLGDQALATKWDTLSVKKYGLNPQSITFQAWDDDHAFTAPVGSFKPNEFGLYDMLGNVGEFCNDSYQSDYYAGSPELNPKGPAEPKGAHVVRGGTFLNGPSLVRVTSRVECQEVYRNYVIGFRVALESDDSP